MAFFKDLDEIDEKKLQAELNLRKSLRDKGLCDYCQRSPQSATCKFPDRHQRQVKEEGRMG